MLGTRQTGLLQFKVADLMRDAPLLPAVRDAACQLLEHWPPACQSAFGALAETWGNNMDKSKQHEKKRAILVPTFELHR